MVQIPETFPVEIGPEPKPEEAVPALTVGSKGARLFWRQAKVQDAVEQVASKIKDAILHGKLRPGESLGGEQALTANYGVSRTVVREALRMLSVAGFVESKRGNGGGTFVCVPRREAITQYLSEALLLLLTVDRVTLAEAIETRRIVEVAVARAAAQRRTGEDLKHFQAVFSQYKRETLSDEQWLDLDIAFHSTVASAAHNRILALPLNALHAVMQPTMNRLILANLQRPLIEAQHFNIYLAIEQQDAPAAEKTVHAHLDYLCQFYPPTSTG